jgi:hypothetical protein
MPMRGQIAMRKRPGAVTSEPDALTWQSIVALIDDPTFTIVVSFIAISLTASLWLAIKLPLADVMAGLIGQVGYYP